MKSGGNTYFKGGRCKADFCNKCVVSVWKLEVKCEKLYFRNKSEARD